LTTDEEAIPQDGVHPSPYVSVSVDSTGLIVSVSGLESTFTGPSTSVDSKRLAAK
jgi:hypothetical protein